MSFFIEENKKLARRDSEMISEPQVLSVPTRIGGYSAVPLVKKGDTVLKYQKIAEGGITLHAPVGGIVEDADENYVVIKNGFFSDTEKLVPAQKSIKELSGEELCDIAKNAGIWCSQNEMPLYNAIGACMGKTAKMIINLCQAQPPVTSLLRLALEHTDELIGGAKILMKACGVRHAVIAVDASNRALLKILRKKCAFTELLSVKSVNKGYPAEKPRHLIYTLDTVETDASKPLADCGYAVFDGMACVDMYNALIKGLPCVTCTVTAEGDCIKEPKNLTVPVGTSASFIAEYCGGTVKEPHKIVLGGPLDGEALWDEDFPVNKNSSAVLFLSENYYRKNESACIRCARCAKVCPMYLMPMKISAAYDNGNIKKCRDYGAQSCIKCGLCSYVCPANIPVTHKISEAMEKLRGENDG